MTPGWKTRDLSKATPKRRPHAAASVHCAGTLSPSAGLLSDIGAAPGVRCGGTAAAALLAVPHATRAVEARGGDSN